MPFYKYEWVAMLKKPAHHENKLVPADTNSTHNSRYFVALNATSFVENGTRLSLFTVLYWVCIDDFEYVSKHAANFIFYWQLKAAAAKSVARCLVCKTINYLNHTTHNTMQICNIQNDFTEHTK